MDMQKVVSALAKNQSKDALEKERTTPTDDDTVSALLQQDAMDGWIEIVRYRANLAVVKVKLEMYTEDTDRIPEILVAINFFSSGNVVFNRYRHL